MKPPEFLQARTVDIAQYGYDGALVRGLIRYMTRLEGERNGRRLVGREMWWVASYDEIARALGGVSRYSVGRTVRRLEADKGLLSKQLDDVDGDQTKAYRVPDDDLQCADSHDGSDQQCADSHGPPVRNRKGPVRNRTTPRAKSHILPLLWEN